MWLSQTDKLIAPVGLVILASCTILVACSGFTGSPSHLIQLETVLFPEWYLGIVSTDVGVIGASDLIRIPCCLLLLGDWIVLSVAGFVIYTEKKFSLG